MYMASLLLALASLPVKAQQNFASISFGATLPQGDYALTGDLSSNGYASRGGAIKFDAAYFPVSYFGIGASFSFGSNYAKRDSLINDLVSYMTSGTVVGVHCRREAAVSRMRELVGATNPAEFFAVATETFFEKPAQLQKRHPDLYRRPCHQGRFDRRSTYA